ncbi:TetR/AcrR family transcriptional regulator [Flindersiella endophytica]
MTRTARATALLDAAITVIAESGLRGLTHRAVDARAGLPNGSASYYFRTRSALLQGVLSRLLELDNEDYVRFASGSLSRTGLTRTFVRIYQHWAGEGREQQYARYLIYLEGRSDPAVRDLLDATNHALADQLAALLEEIGVAHPRRDARLLIALLDGLLYDQLARPNPPVGAAELERRVELVLDTVLPPA